MAGIALVDSREQESRKRVNALEAEYKMYAPWYIDGRRMSVDEFREGQGLHEFQHGNIGDLAPGESKTIEIKINSEEYSNAFEAYSNIAWHLNASLKTNLPRSNFVATNTLPENDPWPAEHFVH